MKYPRLSQEFGKLTTAAANRLLVRSGLVLALSILVCAALQAGLAPGVAGVCLGGVLAAIGAALAVHALLLGIVLHRRAEIERSLAEARRAADEANSARDDFLSNISHEIRTPANAMVSMAELLRETALDAQQETFAVAIQESAAALVVVVDRMLDVSGNGAFRGRAPQPRAEAARPESAPPLPAQTQAAMPVAEDAETPAILLVEDNLMNQKVAVHQLHALGHRVCLAGNGVEALAMLAKHSFDLILMDCQMPVMDGFEATRRIRLAERETGWRVNIVAMTANTMEGDRERCLDAGMDDYLAKPVSRPQLAKVLERYLPREAMGRQAVLPVLDPTRLEDLLGSDPKVQKDMLVLFLNTSSGPVAELHAAAASRDFSAAQPLADRLAGSGDNLGLKEFAALAHQAWIAARAGDGDKLARADADMQEAFERVRHLVNDRGRNDEDIAVRA